MMQRMHRVRRPPRGVSLVIVAIALAAVAAIAGLAIDLANAISNKARLQAAVDAAALAGAKALDQIGTDTAALAAATSVFDANVDPYSDLADLAFPGLQYSKKPVPFAPVSFTMGPSSPRYVRVSVEDRSIGTSLLRVLGIEQLFVRASAVAGPSPALSYACSLLPIAACADMTAGAPDYGFTPGRLIALTFGSAAGSGGTSRLGDAYLVTFDDTGADAVRHYLAGGYEQCLTIPGDPLPVKGGANTGPIEQGLNTRFGIYAGSMSETRYPPDVVVREPSPRLQVSVVNGAEVVTWNGKAYQNVNDSGADFFSHADYLARIAEGPPYERTPRPEGTAVFKRREAALPIVDCASVGKNVAHLPVKKLGCFHLLQRAETSANKTRVFGEYIEKCESSGRPGTDPGATGAYLIQLYRDSDSQDS